MTLVVVADLVTLEAGCFLVNFFGFVALSAVDDVLVVSFSFVEGDDDDELAFAALALRREEPFFFSESGPESATAELVEEAALAVDSGVGEVERRRGGDMALASLEATLAMPFLRLVRLPSVRFCAVIFASAVAGESG